MSHRSYSEQSLAYFIRPADGVPTRPVGGAAAWRGPELTAQPDRWLVELSAAQIVELHDVTAAAMADAVPMADVTAEVVPLPGWADDVARWRSQLDGGLGVVCLRGLPVREWGREFSAYAYWILGHHLGAPGAQNPAGDLLGHVYDEPGRPTDELVRLYRTADDIAFHCDAADVVGLLCLRTAREGGQSRLASSVAVFDEVLARRPDLAPDLFEPFHIDRRDEQPAGDAPTFTLPSAAWDGSSLRTFWHSDYMRSAERHDTVEFSDTRRSLIELYDEIAGSPDFRFDMWLREGDIQLISNHTVVHARTAFDDHDDPDERRHLLRLWLTLD